MKKCTHFVSLSRTLFEANGFTVVDQDPDLFTANQTQSHPTDSDICHVDLDELIHQLEALDDMIFAAVNGDPDALAKAETQWHAVAHATNNALVEESREQYLRFANDIWTTHQGNRNIASQQVAAARDIIALLTR
ncbi:MAG: hypothetical protein JW829_06810 [Pirellulales bacterium]|nr:hypothetical protein [Pirellulales bacterium]